MPVPSAVANRLAAIPNLRLQPDAPLFQYTRFGIGGPASLFCDAKTRDAFVETLDALRRPPTPLLVIGGGTNLVVSDAGFDGVVVRFVGHRIKADNTLVRVGAGAVLQDVVDETIRLGLRGLETMTGIPGYLGGAVYGNAGAYGRSIHEIVESVDIVDGQGIHTLRNAECEFRYRDSIFKRRKDWIILSATLRLEPADPVELSNTASAIRKMRDAKYPPTMKCAGSIFKNLIFAELPPAVQGEIPPTTVREGKVPSAWFLESVGAKGMRRGDIQVASYHANLIYNDGQGTAADLVAVIQELKQRVRDRWHFDLEEEVQYVGF